MMKNIFNSNNNDSKNYTITDIKEIKEGREEIANERNIVKNSRYSISEGIRQNSSIGNNQSARYNTRSNRNITMDTRQSESNLNGNNQESIINKQIDENSNKSSFNLPKNVKEIKDLNQILHKMTEKETDKYWKN